MKKNKKVKKMPKKAGKKKAVKKAKAQVKRHEIVVRVNAQPMVPTTTDLAEPIRDGRSLSIPKTWLSEKQITRMVEKTPPQYVYQRPGKGGGKWDYVSVSYVQRVLDYCFGFNWDFQIVEHGREADHVWVRGRLTVKSPDGARSITKEQFGRSEVKYQKNSKVMLDYGNDLKAASSDALKKCASMLGIARDIYGKTDYKQESGNEPRNPDAPQLQTAHQDVVPEDDAVELVCHGTGKSGCGNDLTRQEYDYSKKIYGKPLCREHQKEARPLKK